VCSSDLVLPTDIVRLYVAAGVHYFEYGNEANLGLEVEGLVEGQPVIGHQHVVAMCNQFIRNVESISAGGGITLVPAMAPGTILDETNEVVCYQTFIRWFQNNAWDWFYHHAKSGYIGVAFHPRGGNHYVMQPDGSVIIDYPDDPVNQLGIPLTDEECRFYGIDDGLRAIINQRRTEDKNPGATLVQDGTSYVVWELIDDLFREALVDPDTGEHFSLPGFGTEAGPEPDELWDIRYPRTNLQSHAAVAMEITRRMNPRHPKAARLSHFCNCFWIWNNEGHGAFRLAGYVNNQQLGGNLPIVARLEAFAATENFVRTFEEEPMPEPQPEPTPTPEEPRPDPLWRVCDATGKQVNAFNNGANALADAVRVGGYVQPFSAPRLVLATEAAPEVAQLRQEVIDLSGRIERAKEALGE